MSPTVVITGLPLVLAVARVPVLDEQVYIGSCTLHYMRCNDAIIGNAFSCNQNYMVYEHERVLALGKENNSYTSPVIDDEFRGSSVYNNQR